MNLSEFSNKRVLVVGDICLDRNRIVDIVEGSCREADIPTFRMKKGRIGHKDEYSPGAGGNVAVNFVSLGADVSIAGVIGKDFHGDILLKKLKNLGIDQKFLQSSDSRSTITFERSYNAADLSKPVARWDTENEYEVPKRILGRLQKQVLYNAKRFDAVFIADYCEVDESTAVITESLLEKLADLKGKIKVFGASRNRIDKFKDFYCIIPNDNELIRANSQVIESFEEKISIERIRRESISFYKKTRPEYLVVTAGSRGAFLYDSAIMQIMPTKPLERSKIDVMGCGDTFSSTLTLADISGYSREDAINLANIAAGTTARKLGTTGAPTQEELYQALK
ncbi:hypothetical protein HYT56_01375 [Candidatus Woesearchaeota archaeon]|nr:hypothetical protein [Candidatus Woesearchaeota archaeon]